MNPDLVPGLVVGVIMAIAFGIAMSDHDIFLSHKRLYKSNTEDNVWFYPVGEERWYWRDKVGQPESYAHVPVKKYHRLSKYVFEHKGLCGSRIIPDDIVKATEEMFNDPTTWRREDTHGA